MRYFAVFVLILSASIPLLPAEQEPALEAKLDAAVGEYTLVEDSFLQAVVRVAAEFEIPMGIEWIRDSGEKVELEFHSTSVRRVVESLLRNQPGYEWDVRNGVLHVFPRSLRENQRNVLNLRLEEYEVKEDYVQFAARRLQIRVQQIIHDPQEEKLPGGIGYSWATGLGDRRVSFTLNDVTVRDILDKLCLAADFKVWMAAFPMTPEPSATGYIRSVSPWSDQISEEPVWFLFRWGWDPVLRKPRPDWQKREISQTTVK